jgi:hypothetical protein
VQNGISNVQTIAITNPGIDTVNVAIDTTPQVPRLEFVPQTEIPVNLDQASAAVQSVQSSDFGGGGGELAVTSERYLELIAISPDNKIIGRYRLEEDALSELDTLFKSLPDGQYQIVLKRTDSDVERLVMKIFVRRGRVIQQSDETEGIRDMPPTEASGQPNNAAVPLEDNPLLVPVVEPGQDDAAMLPGGGPSQETPATEFGWEEVRPNEAMPTRSYSSLRWGASLAAMATVAGGTGWARQVDAALERADGQRWQRLRRAARLGRGRSRGSHRTMPAKSGASELQ